MDQIAELGAWLKQGCQRQAVAKALRKPMTSNEIWQAAKTSASRVQLRDVWFLLRQLQAKGLVHCLNPSAITGKLFVYSDLGRQVASAACGVIFPKLLSEMDWDLYSWVMRGSVRRIVLSELGQAHLLSEPGLTPSQLRRNFRGRHPIGENLILRALQELHHRSLVQAQPVRKKSRQKRYKLTTAGQAFFKMIMA